MITHTEEQLVFAMRELTQRLIPFNYVIPGQSVNDIIRIRETLDRSPALRRFLPEITDLAAVAADKRPSPLNEFSGPGYRVINFVADLPVRMDRFLCRTPDDPLFSENGTIVFVLTEFQIIDARTAENNESGENSHEKYKERQMIARQAALDARHEGRGLRGTVPRSTPPGCRASFGSHRSDADCGRAGGALAERPSSVDSDRPPRAALLSSRVGARGHDDRWQRLPWQRRLVGAELRHAVLEQHRVRQRRGYARAGRDDADQVQRIARRDAHHLAAPRLAADRAQRLERLGRGELLAHEARRPGGRRAARRASPGGGRRAASRATPARASLARARRGTPRRSA